MRIAFITHPWASAIPPSESVAIWTQEIAKRLATEHEVTIWSRSRDVERPPLREDGVEYRFVRGRGDFRLERALRRFDRLRPASRPLFASPLYQASYHLDLLRVLHAEPPDVVHFPTFSQLAPLVRRACPQATVVLHLRDEMLTLLARDMVGRRLRRADLILGCSDFVSRRLREAFPEAAGRTQTIYNGADLTRFAPGEANGQPERPLRLLSVGRISPEKGTHVLLEAFRSIAEHRAGVSLDVVGEEAIPPAEMLASFDDPAVRSYASRYGSGEYLAELRNGLPAELRGNVRFHGKLPHDQLPVRYREADLFVFPSLAEAFGKPIVEAMATGLPAVATRVGGIPEIVVDGETGLLVAPHDPGALAEAVERLAADPGLRRRMGAAGRARAEKLFSYDRIAIELDRLYASAQGGLGPP
jgi:glycosyltransferase involved in cell wall biosynthesis